MPSEYFHVLQVFVYYTDSLYVHMPSWRGRLAKLVAMADYGLYVEMVESHEILLRTDVGDDNNFFFFNSFLL